MFLSKLTINSREYTCNRNRLGEQVQEQQLFELQQMTTEPKYKFEKVNLENAQLKTTPQRCTLRTQKPGQVRSQEGILNLISGLRDYQVSKKAEMYQIRKASPQATPLIPKNNKSRQDTVIFTAIANELDIASKCGFPIPWPTVLPTPVMRADIEPIPITWKTETLKGFGVACNQSMIRLGATGSANLNPFQQKRK